MKIEEMIAAERDMIGKQLDEALARRDAANADVKELRARLYAAPRLHVRRTRKARVASLMEDSGYSHAEAKALVDEGMDVP
jgi:hypothetical protein